MQVIAGIAIVAGLLFSRVLAVLVNQELWLRLLAEKPRGTPLADYSAQIYLPPQARKGLWPGLLFFFPLFWAGMGIGSIDRESFFFPVGMSIAVIGAVLVVGAIWSVMGSAIPNRQLAETRIGLITQSLEQNSATEPISTFRHLWRANYLAELISVASTSMWGSSAASLARIQGFLDQYERDLGRARAGGPPDEKLRMAVDNVAAGNAAAMADWRRQLNELDSQRQRLLDEWPTGPSGVTASLRLTQVKPSFSLTGLKLDDVELSGLVTERRSEMPIILSSLSEAPAVTATGWSRPWLSEFDLLLPVTAGTYKLVIETTAGKPLEQQIQVHGARTVCLISFDIYGDRFAVEVYSQV